MRYRKERCNPAYNICRHIGMYLHPSRFVLRSPVFSHGSHSAHLPKPGFYNSLSKLEWHTLRFPASHPSLQKTPMLPHYIGRLENPKRSSLGNGQCSLSAEYPALFPVPAPFHHIALYKQPTDPPVGCLNQNQLHREQDYRSESPRKPPDNPL